VRLPTTSKPSSGRRRGCRLRNCSQPREPSPPGNQTSCPTGKQANDRAERSPTPPGRKRLAPRRGRPSLRVAAGGHASRDGAGVTRRPRAGCAAGTCGRVPAALRGWLRRVRRFVACLLSLFFLFLRIFFCGLAGGAAGLARRVTAEGSAVGAARGRGGERRGRQGGGGCPARVAAAGGRGEARPRGVLAAGLPGGGRRRQR